MNPLLALAARWRTDANKIRRYGAEVQATALEACAADLEHAAWENAVEELTLKQAALEVGVTSDTIGRWIRDGEVPNAGEKNRPRVRRCDLHQKICPSFPLPKTDHGEPDLVTQLLHEEG